MDVQFCELRIFSSPSDCPLLIVEFFSFFFILDRFFVIPIHRYAIYS